MSDQREEMSTEEQDHVRMIGSMRELIETKMDTTISGFALIVSSDTGDAVTYCDCRNFQAVTGILDGAGQLLHTITKVIEDT